jgi:WD40 repeat protein
MGVNCLSFAPSFIYSPFRENENEDNNNDDINNDNNNNNNIDKIDNILKKSYSRLRFVTGGCDNLIKIWNNIPNQNSTISKKIINQLNLDKKKKKITYNFSQTLLEGHTNWIRGVDWLKSIGNLSETIASCSEDETVRIWKKKNNDWKKYELNKIFGSPTWNVQWSTLGTYLALSTGDNSVYLFKENGDGNWEEYSKIKQEQNIISKLHN